MRNSSDTYLTIFGLRKTHGGRKGRVEKGWGLTQLSEVSVRQGEGRGWTDSAETDPGRSEEASQNGKNILYHGRFCGCFCQLESLLVLFCSPQPQFPKGRSVVSCSLCSALIVPVGSHSGQKENLWWRWGEMADLFKVPETWGALVKAKE